MKKLFPMSAAIGALALLASPVQAADSLSGTTEFYSDDVPVVEHTRTVCDEFGRCWREPRRRTVIIDDTYNYVPPERYIERRHYYDRPAAGVGIDVPGINVGVGIDRW